MSNTLGILMYGNRTVGITEKPSVNFTKIEQTFGFKPPYKHGHDAVNAMQALVDGKNKSVNLFRGNSLPWHYPTLNSHLLQ